MSKIYTIKYQGKLYDIKGGDTAPTQDDLVGLIKDGATPIPGKESIQPQERKQSFFDAASSVSPIAPLARLAGGGLQQMFNRQPLQSSDETMRQSPVAGFLQKSGEQATMAPAHFFNQMAMNAPRSLMNTYTNVEFPESSDNQAANLAAKGFGAAGAITSPMARFLGSAIKAGKYGSAAAGGALGGAAYSTTDDFAGGWQRPIQAATGAVLGPAVTGAVSLASKAPQAYQFAKKVFASKGNLKGVERGISNIESEVAKKELQDAVLKQQISQIDPEQAIKSARQNSLVVKAFGDSEKGVLQSNAKLNKENLIAGFKSKVKDFQNKLYSALVDDNKVARDKAIQFRSKAIDRYGKVVSDVEDSLIKEGKMATIDDYYNNVVKPTLNKFRAENEIRPVAKTDAISNLEAFERGYKAKRFTPEGKPIIQTQPENMSFNEMKNFKNRVFDRKDHYANDFFKNHADFLGGYDETLAGISKEYRPVFEANDFARKNFGTFTSEQIENSGGALQRVAKDLSNGKNPSAKDLSYLRILEEGSPEGTFEGVGKLGQKSQKIASDINSSKTLFDRAKTSLQKDLDDKIKLIEKSIQEDQADILTKGMNQSQDLSRQKTALEGSKLNNLAKKSKLSQAKSTLQLKEKELSRLNNIRRGVIAAGALAGVGAVTGGMPIIKQVSNKVLGNVEY